MHVIRRFIVGAGVILAFVLLLGAAAPSLVDGHTVRDQLVAKLSAWAGGNLRVEGDVRLTSLFELTIEASDVRIESPERFSNVHAITAEEMAARLDIWELLHGRVVFAKVWVKRPVIQLRAPFANATPARLWRTLLLDEGETLERFTEAVQDAPFAYIKLSDARIGTASEADKDAPLQQVTVERRTSPKGFSADLNLSTEAGRIQVDLDRGAFRPVGPTLEAPVRLAASNDALGRLVIDGRIVRANGVRFTGNLDVRDAQWRVLAELLGLPLGEALARARYSAAAALEATGDLISLQNLDLETGGTRATGLLSLALDGERPKLSGTLGLSAIDLSGVSVSGPGGGALLVDDAGTQRHGSAPVDAPRLAAWLEAFDADLRFSADSLAFDGLTTGETAAFLSVGNGTATLDIAELMVFEGMMHGQFSVRFAPDAIRLSGRGNASAIDLAQLLAAIQGPQLASGSADLSFSIGGGGATLGAAARDARLAGQIMAIQGGEMALDVAAMAVAARQNVRNGEDVSATIEMAPERADYDMMRATFELHGGQLRLEPLEVLQDGWIIRGRGRADLARHSLDWRLDAARAPREASGVTAAVDDAGSLFDGETISLHVTGTLQRQWVSYKISELPVGSVEGSAWWWQ